jgi:hypothetical protein
MTEHDTTTTQLEPTGNIEPTPAQPVEFEPEGRCCSGA